MLRLMVLCGLCLVVLAYAWAAPARAFQAQVTVSPAAPVSAPAITPEATASGAAAARPAILSPRPGQALQGTVPIVVETALDGFEAVELEFAYANNPTGTWFTLYQGNQPVSQSNLVQWDTSQISDGTYTLRLTVKLSDGSQQSVEAAGLRVRNYTLIESDTPTPVTPSATAPPADTPAPSQTPTPTGTRRPPTPTPLPANPAVLERSQVLASVVLGGLAVVALFALGGLYAALRRKRR
jgi:hypothetical protein